MEFTRGVVISLNNGLVFAEEFKVDLVLGFVAFERGEVNVEVEAAGVSFGALNEGAESAIEIASGGAPPGYAAVVVCESDGVGLRTVSAGFWGVVNGDFLYRFGIVEHWIRHFPAE